MIKKFPPLPPEYSGAARTANNSGNNVNIDATIGLITGATTGTTTKATKSATNNATVSGYSAEDLLCLLEDGPDDFGIDFSEDDFRCRFSSQTCKDPILLITNALPIITISS